MRILIMVIVLSGLSVGLIVAGNGKVDYSRFDGVIVKQQLHVAGKTGASIEVRRAGNSATVLLRAPTAESLGMYIAYDPKTKKYSPSIIIEDGKSSIRFMILSGVPCIVTNKKIIQINNLPGTPRK